jgi:iron complex transport system substrate-binding protein
MIEAVRVMNTSRVVRRPRTLLLALLLVLTVMAPAVRPQSPPQRIVSLVPAVTEMLFAMGAGGLVVGVGSFDAFPAEVHALPKVGALVDPDFERILSLRPDLVVVYGSQDELIDRLARARIATFRYRHAGLADVTATIREVGVRVGRANEGGRLAAGIDAEIDAIRRAIGQQRKPSTLLVFDREPGTLRGIYASGAVGFMHDMLVAAGGADAMQDVRRESLQMSVELLLARAPEVIVEVQPSRGWTTGVGRAGVSAGSPQRPGPHHRGRPAADPGTSSGGGRSPARRDAASRDAGPIVSRR